MSAAHRLAVKGGDPVREAPWPSRPWLTAEELAEFNGLANAMLATGETFTYQGEQEEAYCREFAAYTGVPYADHVSSGTTAVWIALRALELEPFTEVVVSCMTDPGGMMPIPLLNLIPVPADVAPGRYNVGPEQVAERLTPLTSALVISHIHGEPVDMPGIMKLAEERGLPVIEDCAQAHGATINGRMVGTFGTYGAVSTMYGKHHASGPQGWMIICQGEELYWQARRAADRGKPFNLPPGSTNCMASLNLNGNDLSAAFGRIALRRLPSLLARRREIVAQLREQTCDLTTVSLLPPPAGTECSHWFLDFRFFAERCSCPKDEFLEALAAEGMPGLAPNYGGAMPHLMDWFRERRVFGRSGYPWASPDYHGDRNRDYPCPNMLATNDLLFFTTISELWQDEDVADLVAILRKVDAAFQVGR
ncbi:MAG: hypothetical protein GX100_14015 [candidate division WS1 bacterium]|nr:hypothetical protein [candidate division WS1 bacterium]